MLPGPLQVGDLLAGRYLLLDPVARPEPGGTTVLWRAHDEVLARDVAVRLLPSGERRELLDAAAAAGRASHPGLARVLDAVSERAPRRGGEIAYVIREWVDGEPLDQHLRRTGELAAVDAADLLRQVADALAALHDQGLAHLRLHPGNVVVTAGGRLRVTDGVVPATTLGVDPLVGEEGRDPGGRTTTRPRADPVTADTRDLGALLYALLTRHWPTASTPQPRRGIPAAPVVRGQDLAPHQLRAGVGRQLDHVVLRALAPSQVPALPPLRTPVAVADAAEQATDEERRQRLVTEVARQPGWARRHRARLAAAGFVAAVAATGWYAGLAVGALPRNPGAVDLASSPSPGASASSAPAPLDLRQVLIHDFDPLGDQQEDPDQVRNAVDGDATTAWFTQRYRTASFSGLKAGVGLVLDLRTARLVSQVRVGFTARGTSVELRGASVPPTSLAQTRVLATATDGASLVTLRPEVAIRLRYLVVWITGLPRDPAEGYRVGVTDIAVG